MTEKEVLAFPDRNQPPDDTSIASLLGEKKKYWDHVLDTLSKTYKDITWSWNYYNDGHQWLFKLVQKKKTILWGTVLEKGDFKMTFYFSDKAEEQIFASDLPGKVKKDFADGPHYGKIRAATVLVKSDEDVQSVLKLADIKVKLK
jgi:ABC-type uncharacterized transport system YnjBCD substrate-binding protein